MPEVLTKHPGVVLKVLESGGARCGDGLPQEILTRCPQEAFCALPGGEMCVYGIADFGAMTQLENEDLAPLVCEQDAQDTSSGCAMTGQTGPNGGAALVGALLVGLMIWRRARCPPDVGPSPSPLG